MTSNNLEAVELIIEVQSRLLSGATWGLIKPLDKALKLLQADEDIEVKDKPPCTCHNSKKCEHCIEEVNHSYPTCIAHAKPTKETKQDRLGKLKYRSGIWDSKDPVYLDEFKQLIDILLEEEY